jgi:hypothetical protein
MRLETEIVRHRDFDIRPDGKIYRWFKRKQQWKRVDYLDEGYRRLTFKRKNVLAHRVVF